MRCAECVFACDAAPIDLFPRRSAGRVQCEAAQHPPTIPRGFLQVSELLFVSSASETGGETRQFHPHVMHSALINAVNMVLRVGGGP